MASKHDDFLAICRIVVGARWQELLLFADGSGHVFAWDGEEDLARRVVDDGGQLAGTSGTTTHAHALWLELQADKALWSAKLPARHDASFGVLGMGTTLVAVHAGEGGAERARHLTELLRDALRECRDRDAIFARVRALVRSQPGRLPS